MKIRFCKTLIRNSYIDPHCHSIGWFLYESSLIGISWQTWIQTNCSGKLFLLENLNDLSLNDENDFSERTSMGKLFKISSYTLSNMVRFPSSVVFSWIFFVLKFHVIILWHSFKWSRKFRSCGSLYASFAIFIHILCSLGIQLCYAINFPILITFKAISSILHFLHLLFCIAVYWWNAENRFSFLR